VGTRKKPKSYITPEFGKRTNIWRYHSGENKGFDQLNFDPQESHPAPFPEALARDHILSWSNPGDVVLDPMCGSGTTGKMAMLTDRRFVGIELDPGYFAIAERRIADAARQARGEFRTITDTSTVDDLPLFAEVNA
jgi:site-specific DNA-methyltransferase (adenine-specific)